MPSNYSNSNIKAQKDIDTPMSQKNAPKKGPPEGGLEGRIKHFLFIILTGRWTIILCHQASTGWGPALFGPLPRDSQGGVGVQECTQSTYSELQLLLWLRGSVGRLESRTWIPSELIALIKIVTIASTGSFSRTITRHRLRRAALTWKEGFSVVAPISVIVPHSTWGRNVS